MVLGRVDDDGEGTSFGERKECLTASRLGQRPALVPECCRYAPALLADRRAPSLRATDGVTGLRGRLGSLLGWKLRRGGSPSRRRR